MTKAILALSYTATLAAGGSHMGIRCRPNESNPLTTNLAAPGSVSASGNLGPGEQLKVNKPSDGADGSVSGSGSLDNSAGTVPVALQMHRNGGTIESIATAAAGGSASVTFAFGGLHDGDRLEMVDA
jgi:hypothetical protein